MSISIFSLNLWNLNRDFRDRMAQLDGYLTTANPDIVCLQEVSPVSPGGRPQSDLVCTARTDMARLYSSQYLWDDREEGLATLSRLTLLSFESFMLPAAKGDGLRRLQISAYDHDGQTVLVANTHLAFRFEQNDERLAQCEAITKLLTSAAQHWQTDAIILVGDFNTVPGSAPIACITECALGLRDLFAATDLRRGRVTYPNDGPFFDGDTTSHRWIDYIFATPRFTVQSLGLAMDGLNGNFVSDHVALEANLTLDG